MKFGIYNRIRRNADGGQSGGNADQNPTDKNDNVEAAEQLKKVLAKNDELLGELRKVKDERNSQTDVNKALFEHLGIGDAENPLEALKQKQAEADKKRTEGLSENDKLREQLENTNKTVQELLDSNRKAEETAKQAILDKEVTTSLTAFNEKGRPLLESHIRGVMQQDDNGVFVIKEGQRLSLNDYAKGLESVYPEFMDAGGKGGQGGQFPGKPSRQDAANEKMNKGNVRGAFADIIREKLANS